MPTRFDIEEEILTVPPQEAPQLLTPVEATQKLKISRTTLWRLMAEGDLVPTRVRGLLRFNPTDLATYMDRARQIQ